MKIITRKIELFAKIVTKKRKKNNKNAVIQHENTASHQKLKVDNVNTNNNRGTLII